MDRSNQHLRDEPEGGDIRAADMIEVESDIVEFYKDSTILITGATGYLGKLTLEKLLRVCDVKKIFIIIREKKNKDPRARFEELFDEPSFEPLKRKNANFDRKIQMMCGDAILPNWGLADEDVEVLKTEVDVVFHYAAAVRCDEKLRTATYVNVRAVKDLIRIAKDMKQLKAFVHVSSAYSNCIYQSIEEKFYKPPITAEKLLTILDCLGEDQIDAIAHSLIGLYPNTYIFTKCVAENVLMTDGEKLPITLYRPSIVIGTVKEPVSGWINTIYGLAGIVLGISLGVLRTLHGNPQNKADIVPGDYVVNGAIVSAWDVARIKGLNENKEVLDKDSRDEMFDKEHPVYNYVCSPERPITWDEIHTVNKKYIEQIPSENIVWHPCFKMIETEWIYSLAVLFLHTIPAYIIDILRWCIRKDPILVKTYAKIGKFAKMLSYFTLREWQFENGNVQSLWNKLNSRDKFLFEFSMQLLDWEIYSYTAARGGRLYLLNDPLETVPKGKVKYYKLMIVHYTLLTVFSLIAVKLLWMLCTFIF